MVRRADHSQLASKRPELRTDHPELIELFRWQCH